jgi:hypothetical protein
MKSLVEYFLLSKSENKYLNVDIYGNLSYENLENCDDCSWILYSPKNKFNNNQISFDSELFIISNKYKFMLYYNPATGEQISTKPVIFDGDFKIKDSESLPLKELATIWYISKDKEIYTKIENNRKYIWSILDTTYVTLDEHLADTWEFIVSKSKNMTQKSKCNKLNIIIIILIFLIFIFLIYKFIIKKIDII